VPYRPIAALSQAEGPPQGKLPDAARASAGAGRYPALLTQVAGIMRGILRDPDLAIEAATALDDIPGWDSMVLITVVVEVECRLDVMFEATEIDSLRTAGDLADAIAMKQAQRAV